MEKIFYCKVEFFNNSFSTENVYLQLINNLVKHKKNVLICPLDWGLGHATRIVPLIEMFLNKGANVIIAADNSPLDFLKQRFTNCDFVKLPGFVPEYPRGKLMALKMATQFPEMKRSAGKANKLLQEIIDKKKIDIVVSDNRYELYSSKAYSVFVSHQINIKTVGLQKLVSPFIAWQTTAYIKRFNELWIPDFEQSTNLSGNLSHGVKMPIKEFSFIGPLSRFSNIKISNRKKEFDVMVILSGPEPQRSILENNLEKQLLKTNLKTVFLLGKPGSQTLETKKNIIKIPHLQDNEFVQMIVNSELIISRPGYSTVMDLVVFGKPAVFIPTPGQTEQEYLARKLEKQGSYFYQRQDKMDVELAIEKSKHYRPIKLNNNFEVLNKRISALLDL